MIVDAHNHIIPQGIVSLFEADPEAFGVRVEKADASRVLSTAKVLPIHCFRNSLILRSRSASSMNEDSMRRSFRHPRPSSSTGSRVRRTPSSSATSTKRWRLSSPLPHVV